jgi:hypothetical protein
MIFEGTIKLLQIERTISHCQLSKASLNSLPNFRSCLKSEFQKLPEILNSSQSALKWSRVQSFLCLNNTSMF